jgi:polyhydroxybutyrate depolymerase
MNKNGCFFIPLVLFFITLSFCSGWIFVQPAWGGNATLLSPGHQQLQAGDYTRRVTVNRRERAYVFHIPRDHDSTMPTPVIFAFHGGFGTSETFARVTNLHELAGRVGFIVVYPEGYRRSWNGGDCCGPAKGQDIDDVAFVRAMLEDLTSVANVDPQRVFATGFSNGGIFSYRLACELSDRIAAIAPVSSAMGLSDLACNPTRPVPVLHFHGTADRYAPFAGGPSAYKPAGERRSVPGTINFWLRRNGCTNETQVNYQRGSATCITHPNCRGDAEVILCTIEGMGHEWPGYTPTARMERLLGPGTHDISATDMIVEFFVEHAMRLRN